MSGAYSRRKADELIRFGKVRVSGKTILEPGTQIHPKNDSVYVNNRPIRAENDKVYVMFNKPSHVVTSMNEPEGRPCLRDYFKRVSLRLIPVGKLDWDAEGLLLLTNDGTFAQKVSHPKSGIPRTYLVKVNGQPTDDQLKKLVAGISIIGGKTAAMAARRMPSRGSEKYDWVKLIISDSSNKQIRLMFAKIGFDVKKLKRIAVGSLKLSNLDRGMFRILDSEDLKKVFRIPKEIKERAP